MHIHCYTMYIIHLPGDGIVVYTQNAYIMVNGRDLSLMPDYRVNVNEHGQFHREGTCEAQGNSASFCMQGYKVV